MPGLLRIQTFTLKPKVEVPAGPEKGGGPPPAKAEGAGAGGETPNPFDQYVSRLVRLIPGEIQGLYMVGSGFIPPTEAFALTAWMIVCLILLLISRYRATRNNAGSPQILAIIIAAMAFLLWLFWMGVPPFTPIKESIPYLAPLFILVFTFVIPWAYEGDQVEISS